ncbi:MAG: hypothetical protein HYS81_02410 [Candidatus Aenigmatarchaeota archaeon]|nr:MAG: hypothetical protein HYS81_02410 [Candidatus Aenigmarchaeota archaeon]
MEPQEISEHDRNIIRALRIPHVHGCTLVAEFGEPEDRSCCDARRELRDYLRKKGLVRDGFEQDIPYK